MEESSPQSPSRLEIYFLRHRRELKLIAQAGLLISLIGLGAACFGTDWPGGWKSWLLRYLAVGLLFATRVPADTVGWESAPESLRPLLQPILKTGQLMLLILALMFAWSQWHHQFSVKFVEAGFTALLFAWEALYFAYGDRSAVKSLQGPGKS